MLSNEHGGKHRRASCSACCCCALEQAAAAAAACDEVQRRTADFFSNKTARAPTGGHSEWCGRKAADLTAAPLCCDVSPLCALREEMKRLEASRRRTDFLPAGRVALRGDSRRQRQLAQVPFARETYLTVFAGVSSARATVALYSGDGNSQHANGAGNRPHLETDGAL